jgi:hypothetical protein
MVSSTTHSISAVNRSRSVSSRAVTPKAASTFSSYISLYIVRYTAVVASALSSLGNMVMKSDSRVI